MPLSFRFDATRMISDLRLTVYIRTVTLLLVCNEGPVEYEITNNFVVVFVQGMNIFALDIKAEL